MTTSQPWLPLASSIATTAIAIVAMLGDEGSARADSGRMSVGQIHYLQSCGGCHGLTGASPRSGIPQLRGEVGRFLCTPAGRRYVVQLPNVAFAGMSDAELAMTMNFVMFGIGRDIVPANARPYTTTEVGTLRRQPLKNQPLLEMRMRIVKKAVVGCGVALPTASHA